MSPHPPQPVWETTFVPGGEPDSIIEFGREDFRKDVIGACKRIGFRGKWEEGGGWFSENYGITRSWVLARDCYSAILFEGAVHFASTAVECAINLDGRLQPARKRQKEEHMKRKFPNPTDWLSLMPQNLREAKGQGLPVEKLIGPGESIEKGAPVPAFIQRRNKIAHGDYTDFSVDLSRKLSDKISLKDSHVALAPSVALDQFKKCSAFLYAWVEQKPVVPKFTLY